MTTAGASPVQTYPHFQAAPSLRVFPEQQTPILLHLHRTEQHQQLSVLGVHTIPPSWITLFASFVEAGMVEVAVEGIILEDSYGVMEKLQNCNTNSTQSGYVSISPAITQLMQNMLGSCSCSDATRVLFC